MSDLADLLARAADEAARYRASLPERRVWPEVSGDEVRAALDGPLQDGPRDPAAVVDELVAAVEPGLVASAGPRYFGFVTGGALDAATAADVLAAGWDQLAFNRTSSPAAMAVEEVAARWLKELLGIPASASCGFVTGAQEANTVGLAAARHHVLAQTGWDVERDGLTGAPRVRVIAGAERHGTLDRALRLLGLGTASVEEVAVDGNGAIVAGALSQTLAAGEGPAIVCLQAGNVNTGATDPLRAACEEARRAGAWVHVDGAFGLWAAAAPSRRHLVDGVELADSWGCDGHKWLNVPYDSAYAFVRDPALHAASVNYTASYLVGSDSGAAPVGSDLVLSSSRRARGFATWAALRSLGTQGVADLVERCCLLAERFASKLEVAGAEIGNDVVLNQALARFGDDDAVTDAVIEAVQRDGTCWLGGTTWHGRRWMRISVSNWSTTEADIDRSAEAVSRAALTAAR